MCTEVGDSPNKLFRRELRNDLKMFFPGLANSRYNELFSGSLQWLFVISGFRCIKWVSKVLHHLVQNSDTFCQLFDKNI